MKSQPASASQNPIVQSVRSIARALASLKLTVLLLSLAIVLVFAGTTVQKEMGIWEVQKMYFHSYFVWVDVRLFAPLWQWGFAHLPGRLPMPGGFTIIGLLLVNLTAAHLMRFKFTWKRSGILLTHGGLILLILGEVITASVATEGHMQIDEGQTVSFIEDTRNAELAIIDPLPGNEEQVVAIPHSRLEKQDLISYPTLPFNVRIEKYFANSEPLGPMQVSQLPLKPNQREIDGGEARVTFREVAKVSGVESTQDMPTAQVSLESGGQNIARFPLSTYVGERTELSIDGHVYQFQLRWKRSYKPFSLTLLKFSHDVYTGTADPERGDSGMARNFASNVRLVDPTRNEDREVKIWMNHPLRYAGETFYQASFKPGDKTTILQVVNNPGWVIPYVSCAMVALGLVVHFMMMLVAFIERLDRTDLGPAAAAAKGKGKIPPPMSAGKRRPVAPRARPVEYIVAAGVTIMCLLSLFALAIPPRSTTPFDFDKFGHLPINYEGRVMPMDSLARVSLRVISGRTRVTAADGSSVAPSQWIADVLARREEARNYQIFRIDYPDVLQMLSLPDTRTRFSYAEIMASSDKLREQLMRLESVPAKSRSDYQKRLAELEQHLAIFARLWDGDTLYLAPPAKDSNDWHRVERAQLDAQGDITKMNPGLAAYLATSQSRASDNADQFNAAVDGYQQWLSGTLPAVQSKLSFEVLYNRIEPFYTGIILYTLIFLLACFSWLITPWQKTLQRTAFWVLILTFVFHTLALIARIYIHERPPVTNLYSSAIFIGWAAAGCCIFVESIFRNGIGSLVASVVAIPALVIAHYLALDSGDTMQMLQAVLDTNLWLTTHVLVVTLGYTGTLVAGMMGCVYLVGSLLLTVRDSDDKEEFQKTVARMTYGVICLAMLCSFVGTVLGGIWADQSWGRFWGWDPKENGAVLVVIWNAIILHARFGGLIRFRGLAIMAVFGNVVTAWSWFGTNMMGVGLHSYGFSDSPVIWLSAFVLSQLFIMAIGWAMPAIPPKAQLAPPKAKLAADGRG